MVMEVRVRESSVVKPAEETPKVCLWTSNFDQLCVVHAQAVYFYKPPESTDDGFSSSSGDFFNSTVLKYGLSKALVTYYPVAGRLKRNESGRAEIHCTGEGAIFIEAETDSFMKDLGEFTPNEQLAPLFPRIDYSDNDISSYPPFLVQVTHFKCGGVCLSTALSHILVDGVAGINFINTWSDLCRGVEHIKKPLPYFDRTLLRARDPPKVYFSHIEYKLPSVDLPTTSPLPKIAIVKLNLSTLQANQLKSKCNNYQYRRFSSYEVMAGHIWRCLCIARELKDDEETTISIPLDCRSRARPPLPDGYFGNAIFDNTVRALSGDIVSKPLGYTVNLIHETFRSSGNNEYLRSAIDYLELNPSIRTIAKGKGCNFRLPTWVRLPLYEADFGWGKPIYVGPGVNKFLGRTFLIPNPAESDGGVCLIIPLESEYQMNIFKKVFYDI
ncbi:shikimate O-hydroxycinnamoyltransferase-like [Papaver somniferum]|uniref:shikimate O-hydroxycinnamoyltransferase-like n=1 Tax=Papaver somniferum TaxID=3469 RepID=UPI000E6F7FDE|nr:shikimate O-hydroxycinnamoyltransferase-like [Papaver somniferum]